jgi:hypothetical protein
MFVELRSWLDFDQHETTSSWRVSHDRPDANLQLGNTFPLLVLLSTTTPSPSPITLAGPLAPIKSPGIDLDLLDTLKHNHTTLASRKFEITHPQSILLRVSCH